MRGGLDEEQAERQRWNEREQQRIMDSIKGISNVVHILCTCTVYNVHLYHAMS